MGKLIRRRISNTLNLQPELDRRVKRDSDLVTNISNIVLDGTGTGTDATYEDKYIGANALASKIAKDLIKYSDIVDDTTTGGSLVPASADAVKSLQLQIDGMANGLEYIGTFDASAGVFPANVTQGNFWKVNVSGTVEGIELNVGDMLIANKIVNGVTSSADFDIIDNTEAADILRDSDVIANSDMTVLPDKIATRSAIAQAILTAVAAVTVKVKVDRVTIVANQMTLSHAPLNGVVFNDEAIIETNATDGTFDTWDGVSVVGNLATLSGLNNTATYDGLSAKVTYLYI